MPPIAWPAVLRKLSSTSARAFVSGIVERRRSTCHFGQYNQNEKAVVWRATARHRLLEVVVEEFVWIVLGRVGRQVEELDLIGMVLHPGSDPVRPVDWQVVDDHEQLARGLADQAL